MGRKNPRDKPPPPPLHPCIKKCFRQPTSISRRTDPARLRSRLLLLFNTQSFLPSWVFFVASSSEHLTERLNHKRETKRERSSAKTRFLRWRYKSEVDIQKLFKLLARSCALVHSERAQRSTSSFPGWLSVDCRCVFERNFGTVIERDQGSCLISCMARREDPVPPSFFRTEMLRVDVL